MAASGKNHCQSITAHIICHRWFASGEGWAWPEALDRMVRERILQELRKDLSALRVAGRHRTYQLRDGCLLVRSTPDPDCPDALAQARNPVLIAAVFIPGGSAERVAKADAEQALDKAEGVCRTIATPGNHEALTMNLQGIRIGSSRKSKYLKIGGVTLGVVVALAACLLLAQTGLKGILDPAADEKRIQAWADAAHKQLRSWGIDVKEPRRASTMGDTQSDVINEFLRRLSRQEAWSGLERNHPDAEFLRRLPKKASTVGRNPEEQEVRRAMVALLRALRERPEQDDTNHQPKADNNKSPQEIVTAIAEEMDYLHWYASDARHAIFDGRTKGLGSKEREYIYRFCRRDRWLDRIVDKGICRDLYSIMVNRWAVKGLDHKDLSTRPWFVAGSFFEFLSRDAVQGTATTEPSPATASAGSVTIKDLTQYLPPDFKLPRKQLDSDDLYRRVVGGLRELARLLGFEQPSREDPNKLIDELVEAIGRRARTPDKPADIPEHVADYLKKLGHERPSATTGTR